MHKTGTCHQVVPDAGIRVSEAGSLSVLGLILMDWPVSLHDPSKAMEVVSRCA